MKIKIFVTKEIYRKAMWCGTNTDRIPENCAIALAIREIAPKAAVFSEDSAKRHLIDWDTYTNIPVTYLSPEISSRIRDFDKLSEHPMSRLKLGEFSFEIDFPDEMVEKIGIADLKDILEKSETLEMV